MSHRRDLRLPLCALFSSCIMVMYGEICSDLSNFPHLSRGVVNNGDPFLTLTTPGLLICVRECLVRSLCKSFNFNLTESSCHLNKLSMSALTQDVAGQEMVSSNVDPWSTTIAGFCSGHGCGLNQVCVPQRTKTPPYDCATQCLQLPDIENGRFDLSQTSRDPGTTLTLECDLGFIESGDTVCKAVGTWEQVSCNRGCLQPPQVPNGIMNSSSQAIWAPGSILNYECSQGYSIVGERMCLDNGNWTFAYCGHSIQSCIDVKNCNSSYGDGEYWLSSPAFSNSLVKIYCHNMITSTPKEYITLNPETNTIDYRHTSCALNIIEGNCNEIQQFEKVRISNIIGMVIGHVDVADDTFALPRDATCTRQYGGLIDRSQQCSNPSEHAKNISVDTSGTGVVVSAQTVWVNNDGPSGQLTETRSNNGRTIYITCSLLNDESWCYPSNDKIKLALDTQFQPSLSSATIVACI